MTAPVRRMAILSYHKIGQPSPGGWPTWFYISQEIFASQLQRLGDDGWKVIDMAAFRRGLEDPLSLPERSALITFDDAHRSVLEFGAPVLQRMGYSAVVFVPTQYIGGGNDFDLESQPPERICSWDELEDLQRRNVSVQSHGVSHGVFSRMSDGEVDQELRASKALLESRLNKPVDFMAYPYGDAGKEAAAARDAARKAGYAAACLYGGGPELIPIKDRYRLCRLAMGPDTNLEEMLNAEQGTISQP